MVEPKSAGSALRDLSRARLLDAIHDGVSDRAALCTRTGLARSTVTRLVRELIVAGEITEDGSPASDARSPGRPRKRLRPAPRADLVVAVDLGHSHCEVGVVDASGTVLAARRAPLDVDASPERALRHAERAVRDVLDEVGPASERVRAGALGLPAPVDVDTGSIGDGNVLPRWVDRRPAHELAHRLGLPFAVDNDANLGALAEAAFGVAHGVDDLVWVKVATGIGAGLLLGGRLHRGMGGRAGEIGHVPVDAGGELCRCGNRGCLETMASLTQVLAAVQPRHDTPIAASDVVALVEAGDPGVRRVVGDAGRMIGRVLADVVNSLSPRLVVLGGELSGTGDVLLSGVRESIDRFAQPGLAKDLQLRITALGERSSLLGAAALALETATRSR